MGFQFLQGETILANMDTLRETRQIAVVAVTDKLIATAPVLKFHFLALVTRRLSLTNTKQCNMLRHRRTFFYMLSLLIK